MGSGHLDRDSGAPAVQSRTLNREHGPQTSHQGKDTLRGRGGALESMNPGQGCSCSGLRKVPESPGRRNLNQEKTRKGKRGVSVQIQTCF